MWEREFRQHQSKLLTTLRDIEKGLAGLYQRMDRLCDGDNCYVAQTLSPLADAVVILYSDFLTAYDNIRRVLRRYIAYANHYESKFKEGEMPNEEPAGIQEELFENFALLKAALRILAEAVGAQAVQSADPGHDTPDRSERHSA